MRKSNTRPRQHPRAQSQVQSQQDQHPPAPHQSHLRRPPHHPSRRLTCANNPQSTNTTPRDPNTTSWETLSQRGGGRKAPCHRCLEHQKSDCRETWVPMIPEGLDHPRQTLCQATWDPTTPEDPQADQQAQHHQATAVKEAIPWTRQKERE